MVKKKSSEELMQRPPKAGLRDPTYGGLLMAIYSCELKKNQQRLFMWKFWL
ncbi:hypothetical protein HMPREF1863_00017 [Aedoeadaptatus coxii]|uniref:Uncharacterized protein n=1 Tax=Aedoeadaptatus coxii TaxID=755172 RepID=A0A134ALE6_9FIRM|nr:hypothetical protein HMPREF1863_00017 [Peptoniphilus coxii]